MARGISETDVWNACDALLLEGARPTIERVRLKIGSGSPNTVSPFLETWFRHLGGRIKDPGAFSAPSSVPDPVQQAANHFWEAALAETRRDFDQRLSDGMAGAVEIVAAEKERAARSNAVATEAARSLALLQVQLTEQIATNETERLTHAIARADLAHARVTAKSLELRLAGVEEVLFNERSQHGDALEAAVQRADETQRRAAFEIEHGRQTQLQMEKRETETRMKLDAIQVDFAAVKMRHMSTTQQLKSELRAAAAELERFFQKSAADQATINSLSTQVTESATRADRAVVEASLVKALIVKLELKTRATRAARTRPRRPA